MILIADSSSTRTEWAIVDSGKKIETANTSGINPFFLSRREISHIVRLELPESFFKHRWKKVFLYAPGCATPEKIKIVESSLIAQFHTAVEVKSDLMGAARGLLGNEPGIACLLSTGSNSCVYDGKEIIANVKPCGYLLGDEGSNAYMGKRLIADVLKGIAPKEVVNAFFDKFNAKPDTILDVIYSHEHVNLILASYSIFLAELLDNKYCHDLVYSSFMNFFKRNIATYDYEKFPLSCVGRACFTFSDILKEAAHDFGAKIGKIELNALDGLIAYHTAND